MATILTQTSYPNGKTSEISIQCMSIEVMWTNSGTTENIDLVIQEKAKANNKQVFWEGKGEQLPGGIGLNH